MTFDECLATLHDVISTDTRTINPGDVFVALRGEQFDGHQFVQQAYEKGARLAIVETKQDCPIEQIVVKNTLEAYADFGRAHRLNRAAQVIALTGSCGKTTVKNMLNAIFSSQGETLATHKNFNNEIGVPLTLLGIQPYHQYAIIEIGANSPGEISRNSRVALPDCAMVLMVSEQHVEGMGHAKDIAREKGAIYEGLHEDGVAILPRDDEFYPYFKSLTNGYDTLTFGFSPKADITASEIVQTQDGHTEARIHTPDGSFVCKLQLLGRHNIYNAMAATAVAHAYHVPLKDIQLALASLPPEDKRLCVYPGQQGAKLIDDCYNASPASILAALEILSAHPGEKIWVFGGIGELGDRSDYYHKTVGKEAKRLGITAIYAVGEKSQLTLRAFGSGGLHFNSKEELVETLKKKLNPGVTVLIKGSRAKKLETVTEALRER